MGFDSNDPAERILDVALTLFMEFGYRRTTMDTVAKRLGVSRVTLYRHYADKSALFQAVFFREFQRATFDIEQRLGLLSIEENPVITGFVQAVLLARKHSLIRRLLDTDPEWLVLHMTLDGETLLQWARMTASAFLHQPKFKDWFKEPDLDLAGEVFVRLMVSAILTPGGILTSDDEHELSRVAAFLVKPLLREPPQ